MRPLRAGLSWCLHAGRPVFLDILADRYFMLRPGLADLFLRAASGETLDPTEQARLDASGLFRLGPTMMGARSAPPPVPRRDFPHAGVRAPAMDIGRALLDETCASLSLRQRPLAQVVARYVDGPRGEAPTNPRATLAPIVAAFAWTGHMRGTAGRCLPRALAFLRAGHRRGLRPMLVLGIRLDPFRAHAWVQSGCKVLVGDYEEARAYSPILVLR